MRAVRLTSSGQVATTKVNIYGFAITGGADAATAIIYNEADSSSTDAKRVAELGVAAGLSDDISFHPEGLYLEAGAYIEITGTTPEVYVYIR